MAKAQNKWTPQRLNKAADAIEELGTLGKAARALGYRACAALTNKASQLQKKEDSGSPLEKAERRFLDAVMTRRGKLPVQYRSDDGRRLKKGSRLADVATESRTLTAIQTNRVNELDPKILTAERMYLEDAIDKWAADRKRNGRIMFTERDNDMMGQINKISTNHQKNLPKNIEGNIDVNARIEVRNMSDEELKAEMRKFHEKRKELEAQEAKAKRLQPRVIDAEYRDVEVSRAGS